MNKTNTSTSFDFLPSHFLVNIQNFLNNFFKSFIHKKFIYIYLLFIPNIIFVYLYNNQKNNNQTLNKKIGKNVCIWNLLHSLVFFILCIIIQPETIYDYINIIIVMILWFLFEYIVYEINKKLNIIKINEKIINNENGVYNNPYIPRYDDFVFNIIGVILYIIYKNKVNIYNSIKKNYKYLIIILILYIIITTIEFNLSDKKKYNARLEKEGFTFVKSKNEALKKLPKNYVFIKYKYIIKGCSLSTYHRDVTSSQYEFNTKYPVYTLITYKNTGQLLSICPGSHKTVPYLYSNGYIINCKKNEYCLFNCDLVHAGAINSFGDKRHVIQYKIAHKNDLDKFKTLFNINKTHIGKCNRNKIYDYCLRKISLLFCYPINHIFTDLLQNKNEKSIINKIGLYIYGNEFYNK